MLHGSTLVTGAAGFAGAHLLNHLSRATPDRLIHGWSRTADRLRTSPPSVQWRSVDMLDARAVSAAIASAAPTQIYHLAGASHAGASWQQPATSLEIHVRGTHHLLEAVRAHAPQCRVLVVSSGMIYRAQDHAVDEEAALGPVSPYALSKLAEDQLSLHAAANDGLDVVVARPFNHTGPGQTPAFAASSFARQIADIERGTTPPAIAVGNLDAARDMSDVRDVVSAYAALMQSGRTGLAYNVCRGTAVTMSELLNQLLALSHTRVDLVQDPARLRPNDLPFLAGNPDRIHRDTGWVSTMPLAETLTDLLDYWRNALAESH